MWWNLGPTTDVKLHIRPDPRDVAAHMQRIHHVRNSCPEAGRIMPIVRLAYLHVGGQYRTAWEPFK